MSNEAGLTNPPGGGLNVQSEESEKYDFSATWGKLIAYCRSFFPAIIIALLCAIGGSVFTILGPDKLKDMTNIITEGLMGSVNLETITSLV